MNIQCNKSMLPTPSILQEKTQVIIAIEIL